jgi:type I site-specific restriction endonuclease
MNLQGKPVVTNARLRRHVFRPPCNEPAFSDTFARFHIFRVCLQRHSRHQVADYRDNMPTPEELARQTIDKQLTACGWVVQDMSGLNRYASLGIAVREFPLDTGEADYLLFVEGKAVGVIEAKPEGTTLSGVAEQAAHYVVGLPQNIPHVKLPLPFQYESTGVETLFRDNRDPAPVCVPSSRAVE